MAWGFNRLKMEERHQLVAEQAAASRRATDAQVLEDAERLIGVRNERQAKRMPMLFLPTIGAAVPRGTGSCGCAARRCRTIQATRALIPFMRSCRPNAPFPELLCPSRTGIADEVRIERTRRVLG